MATVHMKPQAVDAVPVFNRNFDDFLDFLNVEASPSVSPKRFSLVFRIDMRTLAAQARVHRNTLSRTPDAESVQSYLRESLRVMRAATDVTDSIEKALFWFKNQPLPVFDYKTPQDLVSEKRTDALIKYLQSLRAGYAG